MATSGSNNPQPTYGATGGMQITNNGASAGIDLESRPLINGSDERGADGEYEGTRGLGNR